MVVCTKLHKMNAPPKNNKDQLNLYRKQLAKHTTKSLRECARRTRHAACPQKTMARVDMRTTKRQINNVNITPLLPEILQKLAKFGRILTSLRAW